MVNYYDEIEIEDMDFDESKGIYTYPCPCGDKFQISLRQLGTGYERAECPSCSLIIRVVYDMMDFEQYAGADEEQQDSKENVQPAAATTAAEAVKA